MRILLALFCACASSMLGGCVIERENAGRTLNLIGDNQGNFSSLYGVSLRGSTDQLFGLGLNYGDGLVWHPVNKVWYSVSTDQNEFSTLTRIRREGDSTPLFGLGQRFDRGVAYRNKDQQLYALSRDAGAISFNRIALEGSVTHLFQLGSGYSGLAYDPATDFFYSIQLDASGFSTLVRISPMGETNQLFGVGVNFRGGLAYHAGRGVFFAVAEDMDGFASLYEINPGGRILKLFGLGFGFREATLSLAADVPAPGLWRRSPIRGERFVFGEQIEFSAAVTIASPTKGYDVAPNSVISWSSDIDGILGNGGFLKISTLSVGDHEVVIEGAGFTDTVNIRVLPDLEVFYRAEPSPAEISRIKRDLEIEYKDGLGADEAWAAYRGLAFDPSRPGPSALRVISLLDLLRHQQFAEPLPMAGGASIYEHFRQWTPKIILRLDCGVSAAAGESITLGRGMSEWLSSNSGPGDACKTTAPGAIQTPYVLPLQLLVHESRHLQPGEPGHTDCTGGSDVSDDQKLENGSGYAWGALYLMWIYKYGVHDSSAAKNWAKSAAKGLLETRFCEPPTHSNPKVQAIINELLTQ